MLFEGSQDVVGGGGGGGNSYLRGARVTSPAPIYRGGLALSCGAVRAVDTVISVESNRIQYVYYQLNYVYFQLSQHRDDGARSCVETPSLTFVFMPAMLFL